MNVFNKVTIESLKKNRTRTIVTIIGIILSAAMICAVTSFASSIQNYLLRSAIYMDGDWHGSEQNADLELSETIKDSGKIKSITVLQQLGYAMAENCENEFKPYIYVLGVDDTAKEVLPIHLISGKYPSSSNEILLPEHIVSNGGTTYQIGDEITLELGNRMLEGATLYQSTPCYVYGEDGEVFNNERLEIKESRNYKVVGFYERISSKIESRTAPGYTAITLMDKEMNANYLYSMYFKMDHPREIFDFYKQYGLFGPENTDVLMYSGISQFGGFHTILYSLAAIVIGLIMFGSVSLIYNAFAISISERMKQFGLLSSLGATKKQLRKMVLYEALLVSVIGIPLGIISGIFGIGITLMLIGAKFKAFGYPVDMELSFSVTTIIIAILVSFVTVLISAWIPSKRAMKVSSIEAIRQTSDIKDKGKGIKTSKLVYKVWGLSGVLASKHYHRSKKKYRTTIISLFISIVLFVSASSFGEYLMESVEGGFGAADYDLTFSALLDDQSTSIKPEELFSMTTDVKDIERGVYLQEYYFDASIEQKYLNKDSISKIGANQNGTTDVSIDGYVYFVNDSEFERLLKENKLNKEDYYNKKSPLAIALDGNISFDFAAEKYVTLNLLNSNTGVFECTEIKNINGYYYNCIDTSSGEEIYIYNAEDDDSKSIQLTKDEAKIHYTMKSGKTIYEKPFYISNDYVAIKLIYPMSMKESVLPDESENAKTKYYRYYYTSSNHKSSEETLEQTLVDNGLTSTSVYNYAEDVENSRNVITIIKVFSYGFIVLISLIAAANVFNTISTNINLRRREFAMLKTVGMTEKGFNKMMNYECLLYGLRSLLLGLPVSIGISYLIYLSITDGIEIAFHLPLAAMGIATLSVFLVVFVTMMYSMMKIKKDNPIDALKNENL